METYANRNSELLKRCKDGDKSARDALCSENMGLVKRIAAGFSKSGAAYEDLVQTGAIGLIKAIDNFDISQNVNFSTYAVPMILGEIRRFLRDDGLIKVSRSLKQMAIKGARAREILVKELGEEKNEEETSKEDTAEKAAPKEGSFEMIKQAISDICISMKSRSSEYLFRP